MGWRAGGNACGETSVTRAGMRTPTLPYVAIRTPCGTCKGVGHFHEEPMLMAASFAAHADEHETAPEFRAGQRKLQSACGNALHHRLHLSRADCRRCLDPRWSLSRPHTVLLESCP